MFRKFQDLHVFPLGYSLKILSQKTVLLKSIVHSIGEVTQRACSDHADTGCFDYTLKGVRV